MVESQSFACVSYFHDVEAWVSPKVEVSPIPIQSKSDDIFYSAKGRLYAYYLLLKELEADFKDVVEGVGFTTGKIVKVDEQVRTAADGVVTLKKF